MGTTPRERFLRERDRITKTDDEGNFVHVDDPEVRAALLGFADALDPEVPHKLIPVIRGGALQGRESKSNNTAKTYISALRTGHERGLNLLDDDPKTINRFYSQLITENDERRPGVVADDYTNDISKGTASNHQAAARAFYRWANDPTPPDDAERPETAVAWADVNGSRSILMFSEDGSPSHVNEDNNPDGDDLDAMRLACLQGLNTHRDRALLETASGTGQRVYCLVTLRVGGVRGHLDGDCSCGLPFPHVRLNPEISGDGDKGAIETAGLVRPFVADPGPVKELIQNHQLRDPDVREEVGAPDEFSDCYLFVGDLKQTHTAPADHWSAYGANDMLKRRKADTADLHGVETVTADVNPHSWRAFAYSRSKSLPIPEKARRAVFGWSPGSDTGPKFYDKTDVVDAMRDFAEGHAEAFGGDDGAATVAEQVTGASVAGDLAPEVRREIAEEIADSGEFVRADEVETLVADAVQAALSGEPADPSDEARRDALDKVERATNPDGKTGKSDSENTHAGPFVHRDDDGGVDPTWTHGDEYKG